MTLPCSYDNEDILLELDSSNNITARYTHGPGIDEPLIMEKGGQSFFYHADGLGSITEITNQSGTVVQAYTYSSFGKIESQLDPNFIQPYTFTAREFDPETGLYFYRARYYDPSTGRFVSEDRIKFAGGVNFYSYVENNPIVWLDPAGVLRWSWRGAAIGAAAGATEGAIAGAIGGAIVGGAPTAATGAALGAVFGGIGGAIAGGLGGQGGVGGGLVGAIGGGIAGATEGLPGVVGGAVGGAISGAITGALTQGGVPGAVVGGLQGAIAGGIGGAIGTALGGVQPAAAAQIGCPK